MILPIYTYGQKILKQRAKEIPQDYPNLTNLINNMWETMYNAKGVGLAAPQIGLSMRIFVIDTIQIMDEAEKEKGIKQVFINPAVIEETGMAWTYEEACLSIPNISGDVDRMSAVTMKYLDENFQEHMKTFDGIHGRVIQHEFDHLEGILFTELLKPIKKNLIRRKLENIKKGKINDVDYPLRTSR